MRVSWRFRFNWRSSSSPGGCSTRDGNRSDATWPYSRAIRHLCRPTHTDRSGLRSGDDSRRPGLGHPDAARARDPWAGVTWVFTQFDVTPEQHPLTNSRSGRGVGASFVPAAGVSRGTDHRGTRLSRHPVAVDDRRARTEYQWVCKRARSGPPAARPLIVMAIAAGMPIAALIIALITVQAGRPARSSSRSFCRIGLAVSVDRRAARETSLSRSVCLGRLLRPRPLGRVADRRFRCSSWVGSWLARRSDARRPRADRRARAVQRGLGRLRTTRRGVK